MYLLMTEFGYPEVTLCGLRMLTCSYPEIPVWPKVHNCYCVFTALFITCQLYFFHMFIRKTKKLKRGFSGVCESC